MIGEKKGVEHLAEKMLLSCSIFLLLFSSAWYAHTKIDRRHHIQHPETLLNEPDGVGISEYRPYVEDDPDEELTDMFKPFAPREYIRIR